MYYRQFGASKGASVSIRRGISYERDRKFHLLYGTSGPSDIDENFTWEETKDFTCLSGKDRGFQQLLHCGDDQVIAYREYTREMYTKIKIALKY